MTEQDRDQLLHRAQLALDTIRPHLEVDNGDVELVGITDEMVLEIKWLGTCQSCEMKNMTLRGGITHTIRTMIPEINEVVAVN